MTFDNSNHETFPDVPVTLTYVQANALRTLCNMQADRYGLVQGNAVVDAGSRITRMMGQVLREAQAAHPTTERESS